MKIKKFNENKTEVGLNEIIEDIKSDSKMSEFDVSGDVLSNSWVVRLHSGHFFNRDIGNVLWLQLKKVQNKKYHLIII